MIMDIVQSKYNEFRNETGNVPETVIMSKELAYELEHSLYRKNSVVNIDKSLTMVTVLGMKIVKTIRPGIVEVY